MRKITTDQSGLATGAEWIDRGGLVHHQQASVVVLAANGIGTPRLLLLSASSRFPSGLANSSGLVGKRLMMQAVGQVVGVYDKHLASWIGPRGRPLYSAQFAETDWTTGYPSRCQWTLAPTKGPLEVLGKFAGLPISERIGVNAHRIVERALGRSFTWWVSVEDLPSEENALTLDVTMTDSDGLAVPKIRYCISEAAKAVVAWNIERAIEAHQASGAVETQVPAVGQETGWHLLGTARMGADPDSSVVDPFGRCHDVPNLFVVDGSVFVTAGASNPTSTITAIALRTAEHIATTARAQSVPA